MRRTGYVFAIGAACAFPGGASAVEETFGLYALGSGAVGAGQTAPAGVYFTTAVNYMQYKASKDVVFGGITLKTNAYLPAIIGNLTAVLPVDVLGGQLSVSATAGAGNNRMLASVESGKSVTRVAQSWGGTDTALKVSLGWNGPVFSHKVSITQWIPTGYFQKGFTPITGFNRPGTNFSWAATIMEPTSKIEFSGTAGFTIEGYNNLTDYRSGNTIHFEEGLSKHFDNGFRIGVIAYQYVQVSPDIGGGLLLGPFYTRAAAVGGSAGYTTMIADHLVIFNLQATKEIAAHNRLKATGGLFSTTVKF